MSLPFPLCFLKDKKLNNPHVKMTQKAIAEGLPIDYSFEAMMLVEILSVRPITKVGEELSDEIRAAILKSFDDPHFDKTILDLSFRFDVNMFQFYGQIQEVLRASSNHVEPRENQLEQDWLTACFSFQRV